MSITATAHEKMMKGMLLNTGVSGLADIIMKMVTKNG